MLDEPDLAIIRRVPLFQRMPEVALQNILSAVFAREYEKGQVLFLRDDPADCFFIVIDGWVKVYRDTPDGDEAVIGVFTRGESIAEAAVFLGMDYPASAQVVTQARLAPILGGPFRNQVSEMPEIAMNMLASMSHRQHHLVSEVEQLKTRSASLRVVDFLLKLCAVTSGPAIVSLPYDKTLISRRLGMQPESLSRILAKLRRLGVKTEQNQVVIADVGSLTDYRDGHASEYRLTAS